MYPPLEDEVGTYLVQKRVKYILEFGFLTKKDDLSGGSSSLQWKRPSHCLLAWGLQVSLLSRLPEAGE